MTIQFTGTEFLVYLGSLLYSRHDNRRDAELTICEYRRLVKVGRA